MNRTIGVWGVSSHEEHLIMCLLRLLDSRTHDTWSLLQPSEAEVVIINADAETDDRPDTHSRVVVEYTQDSARDGELTLHRPIRSPELLQLLNRLSERLDGSGLARPTSAYGVREGATRRESPVHAGAYDTRNIIGRIRSKLGMTG